MKVLAVLFLARMLAAEADDTWQGATPLQGFGCGVWASGTDEDWWRLRRDHHTAVTLYMDTGQGCLCSCPKGDPAIVGLEVYDVTGALLLSYAGTSPGLSILPLQGLPLGTPVWLKTSGVPVGTAGWSAYRLLVF